MTTGEGPAVSGGASGEETALGTKDVTKLPRRGTVLVRSAGPPRVPAGRCIDVRPGPFATFDGDRLWMPLSVHAGDERRRFERSELPAVEDAVVAALRGGESTVEADSGPAVDSTEAAMDHGSDVATLRYGDRAACRRMLPTAAAEAIERRLAAAAERASSTLVTWTTGDPRPGDGRRYDVVLDAPRGRQE